MVILACISSYNMNISNRGGSIGCPSTSVMQGVHPEELCLHFFCCCREHPFWGIVSCTVLTYFSFLLIGFTLAVDASLGVLTLNRPLDRETAPIFTVIIAATDQGPENNQAIVCYSLLAIL